jgi:N-acetylglucosaminyldiphosphoundecaprenol N-acetyl-beta-D-mannosaminyltransferase
MEVLGISLQDLTLRESMRKVDQFFRDGKVSTIALITMKGLIVAQDSPAIKKWMDSLDMTVAADADILRAADINYRSRIHDVENKQFIVEFLKKLVRQHKTVYLLGQTEADVKKLEEELTAYQENLQIVGRLAIDELEYDDDFIVNDINMQLPGVLISNLSSPKREEFLADNHMKLNVAIWLMVRADHDLGKQKQKFFKKMYHRLMKKWFHLRLDRYQEELEQNKEEEKE